MKKLFISIIVISTLSLAINRHITGEVFKIDSPIKKEYVTIGSIRMIKAYCSIDHSNLKTNSGMVLRLYPDGSFKYRRYAIKPKYINTLFGRVRKGNRTHTIGGDSFKSFTRGQYIIQDNNLIDTDKKEYFKYTYSLQTIPTEYKQKLIAYIER